MAGRQLYFVSPNSSKAGKADGQLRCQTCFLPFKTSQALRDHVGAFQLEMHQLMARMLEAQAHMPRDELYDGNDDSDDGEGEDDDNDDDNDDDDDDGGHADDAGANNGLLVLGGKDQVGPSCPYPACHRKKPFKDEKALKRHYEKHVRCFEICIYCRDLFTQVRQYIRHECKPKGLRDRDKEFYKKERCAQLRKCATEGMNQMLASVDTSRRNHKETRKRGRGTDECSSLNQPPKRHRVGIGSASWPFQASEDDLGPASRSNLLTSIQPTPVPSLPTHHDGSATSTGFLSNAEFSSGAPFAFSRNMDGSSGFTHGGMYAPIFGDVTITPYYNVGQHHEQLYAFPPNALNGRYPAVDQPEAPSEGILPVPGTQDQGGFDQTSDGRGASSY